MSDVCSSDLNLPRYALEGSRLATCLSNCCQSPPEIIATSATASRSASACPIRSSSGCLLSASVPSRSKAIRAFMPIAPRWRLGNRACRARLLGDRLLSSEQLPPVFGTDRLYRCRKERTRTEEHTSELQSLMRITYAVFCL